MFSQCHYWLIESQVWVETWCWNFQFFAKRLWKLCQQRSCSLLGAAHPIFKQHWIFHLVKLDFPEASVRVVLSCPLELQSSQIICPLHYIFSYVNKRVIPLSFTSVCFLEVAWVTYWVFLWLSMSLKSLVPRSESYHAHIFWQNKKIRTTEYLPPQLTWAPHLFVWFDIFHSVFKFIFQFIS